ncbi:MAG: FmdE family protein [Candidatus Bathycorpusculaceae bacterium]
MLNEEDRLKSLIIEAEKLHGHLGPFLVIGVRMGVIAKKILNNNLYATVKTPFLTPFSCVVDGVQAATTCTIGNQRLKIEDSSGEIAAYFKTLNPHKTLRIIVNPETVKALVDKLSEGIPNEDLAWEIAHKPEYELFRIETQ